MNYVVSGVAYGLLHSSSLRRAATVVGQRSYVYDFDYLDTGAMHCADSGLTTVAGTLDVGLHLAQAEIIGHLCAILRRHLGVLLGGVLL